MSPSHLLPAAHCAEASWSRHTEMLCRLPCRVEGLGSMPRRLGALRKETHLSVMVASRLLDAIRQLFGTKMASPGLLAEGFATQAPLLNTTCRGSSARSHFTSKDTCPTSVWHLLRILKVDLLRQALKEQELLIQKRKSMTF